MNIEDQLAKVKQPLSTSATLPPRCYTCEDWARKEQEKIFARVWVSIGRRDRWKKAGDFICIDVAGVPMVVTMDDAGELHALANTCSHRGMKLKADEGNCQQLVCPFHAWTYSLSGELISAPRMENCAQSEVGFKESDYNLSTIRLEQSDGFVFVCLDQEQPSLQDWLADFGEVHLPWSLSDLETARVVKLDVNCNWKTFIEVFNEYYHLPFVHPNSLDGLYLEPDESDTVIGEFATQFGITSGTAALLEEAQNHALPPIVTLQEREQKGTRYTWAFPNMTFAACSDSLWMYEVYPLGAHRCHVVQTICFPGTSVSLPDFAQKAQRYYDRIDEAIAEDLPFLEAQQQGLDSPLAKQGRFSALEPCVGHFACWYASYMTL